MSSFARKILDNILGVGRGGVNITPSDDTAVEFRAVYVGGAGDVHVTGIDGEECTFYDCPVGFVIPMAVIKVWNEGTDATLLVGIK